MEPVSYGTCPHRFTHPEEGKYNFRKPSTSQIPKARTESQLRKPAAKAQEPEIAFLLPHLNVDSATQFTLNPFTK